MSYKNQVMLLAATTIGCTFVLLARQLGEHPEFLSMHWNMLLAWTPLAINLVVNWVYQRTKSLTNPTMIGILFVWLIFYPNAPYLITDLIYHDLSWIDRVIFFFYALVGVWIAILSLKMIVRIVEEKNKSLATLFVAFVTVASGFALHMGHYQRWNSWDIFVQPIPLLVDSWIQIPASLPMVITYSFFFSFLWNFFLRENKALNDP